MNNNAYFCPGWDAVNATDILIFDTMADARAFTAQRDRAIHMGEAMETPADVVNYIARLIQLETRWGFHRLTPTQRGLLPVAATRTIPPPTMVQRTLARAYNAAVGNGVGNHNNMYFGASDLPPTEPALYAMMLLQFALSR